MPRAIYVVKPGDTITKITKQFQLSDPRALQHLNLGAVSEDLSLVRAGTSLKIPRSRDEYRNRIRRLEDLEREFIEDSEGLRREIESGYEKVKSTEETLNTIADFSTLAVGGVRSSLVYAGRVRTFALSKTAFKMLNKAISKLDGMEDSQEGIVFEKLGDAGASGAAQSILGHGFKPSGDLPKEIAKGIAEKAAVTAAKAAASAEYADDAAQAVKFVCEWVLNGLTEAAGAVQPSYVARKFASLVGIETPEAARDAALHMIAVSRRETILHLQQTRRALEDEMHTAYP